MLEEARRHVTIEVEPLPAVFTIDDSLAAREVIWGTDNIFKSYQVSRGDVDAAFANAAAIVEGEYETGAQEQLYIEPNGMLAVASPEDGVTVWGSMQCPYYVHKRARAPVRPADATRFASCRWRPAAGSAARRSIRRSSPAMRRCSRGSPAVR